MQSAGPDLPPPVNHVFVDFENIHQLEPDIIGGKTIHLVLLVGAKQTKLDLGVVEKCLQHAATVELIRLTSSGKNALDFALAYYVGRAALSDPTGYFHIVSHDKGFDPLIEHLRSKHIRAHRHEDFTTLKLGAAAPASAATLTPATPRPPAKVPAPPRKTESPPALDESATRVLTHLRAHPKNRPARKPALVRHLLTVLGNKKTESEVLSVIETLRKAGYLALDDKDKVTYFLDRK